MYTPGTLKSWRAYNENDNIDLVKQDKVNRQYRTRIPNQYQLP